MKTLKNGQKQAIKFAKHWFHQQTYYKLRNRGGGLFIIATFHIARLCKQFNQVCTTNFYATF